MRTLMKLRIHLGLMAMLVCALVGLACEGPQGSDGPAGSEGNPGPAGVAGSVGPAGLQGTPGPAGPQGPAGSQGPEGPQGEEGPQGPRGAEGPQGPQGDVEGLEGPRGPRGETGPQGPRGLAGSPGKVADFSELASRVQDSVVSVDAPDWIGTGVFVEPDCSILTARHLLGKGTNDQDIHRQASITFRDGQVIQARVNYELADKDLALLKPTRSVNCQTLPMASRPLQVGEAVLIVGFSDFGSDSNLSAVPGHVINVDTGSTLDFLVLGLVTQGGSGSPIINTDGEVVGPVWGSWAYTLDAAGNWIYEDFVVAGIDAAKHLK